jgi:hypothetical protein
LDHLHIAVQMVAHVRRGEATTTKYLARFAIEWKQLKP